MKKSLVMSACVVTLVAGATIAAPSASAAKVPADRVVFLERVDARNIDLGAAGPSVGDLRVTRGIVRATRVREEGEAIKVCRDYLAWGAGPRASQFLVLAAKARALLEGAEKPTIAHLESIALPVMRHRIVTNFNAEADGVKADDVVRLILDSVRQGSGSRELDSVVR
jgi:MoxR-like ATPase